MVKNFLDWIREQKYTEKPNYIPPGNQIHWTERVEEIKLVIDIDAMEHAIARMTRADNEGGDIEKQEILTLLDVAIPKVLKEIQDEKIKKPFPKIVLTDQRSNLNVVIRLEGDFSVLDINVVVVTVMRKRDFTVSRYQPKGGGLPVPCPRYFF